MENKNESAPENTNQGAEENKSENAPAASENEITNNSPESEKALESTSEKAPNYVEPNPEYRPETSNLGNDEDGTPKISAHPVLNKVGKELINSFAEREKTNLPKLTITEIKNMCRLQNMDMPRFQYSHIKKLTGRVILVADGAILELPTDINQEFNFGIDYEEMKADAIAAGKEWGEKQLAQAKAEAELDEKDKNRSSVKKLEMIASEITRAFEERAKTNLPGITEKDILTLCRNHIKGVGISAQFENEERTLGRFKLTEFLNELIVPSEELPAFTFGVDYEVAHNAIVEEGKK